jgi:phosphoglycerate dehydrogenase-like enzyme
VNPTLAGATLGILGLGAIGVEVARLAAGLGMRVIGTKRGRTTAAAAAGATHLRGGDVDEVRLARREPRFAIVPRLIGRAFCPDSWRAGS